MGAVGSFFSDVWNDYSGGFLNFLLLLVRALAVAIIGNWLINKASEMANKATRRTKGIDPTIARFMISIVRGILKFFLFITVLGVLNVDNSGFVAMIAAGTFALGFALEGTLANMAAGFILLMLKPFKVGQVVTVAGETTGRVKAIEMFNTSIITLSGEHVIVPNGDITSDKITNWHLEGALRLEVPFSVGYKHNVKKIRRVLLAEVAKDQRVLREPPAQVVVSELGEEGVTLELRAWVKPDHYFVIRHSLAERIKIIHPHEHVGDERAELLPDEEDYPVDDKPDDDDDDEEEKGGDAQSSGKAEARPSLFATLSKLTGSKKEVTAASQQPAEKPLGAESKASLPAAESQQALLASSESKQSLAPGPAPAPAAAPLASPRPPAAAAAAAPSQPAAARGAVSASPTAPAAQQSDPNLSDLLG
jgi:small conductance mechanosensitive channel